MARRRYLIFVLIPFFFITCNRAKKNYFSEFPSKFDLNGEIVNLKIPFKGGTLYLYDSIIIFTNTPGNIKYIHIFHRKDFKYLTSSGVIGRGPGEITNPFLVTLYDKKGIIWFMDMGRRKIMRFPVDSILNNPDFRPAYGLPVPTEKILIIQYEPFNSELFSFTNNENGILISFFNHHGNILDSLHIKDNIGLLDGVDSKSRTYMTLYQYTFHPHKNKIALTHRFSDIVTIVDCKGNILTSVQGPDLISQIPQYEDNEQIITYTEVISDDKYIYCLYKGQKRFKQEGSTISTYAKNLHVFDWNGNPVAQITFEYSIISFTIDRQYKRIITFSPELGDIVYYELPI